MTRIDFHTDVADRILYACRLVRKARAAAVDSRVVILLKDKRDLAAMDRALWTFSDQDFLPHALANDALAVNSPVILTDQVDDMPHHDILINLSGALPSPFAKFDRVIEIVAQDEDDIVAGRDRYGYYRQRGYSLTHSVASQT